MAWLAYAGPFGDASSRAHGVTMAMTMISRLSVAILAQAWAVAWRANLAPFGLKGVPWGNFNFVSIDFRASPVPRPQGPRSILPLTPLAMASDGSGAGPELPSEAQRHRYEAQASHERPDHAPSPRRDSGGLRPVRLHHPQAPVSAVETGGVQQHAKSHPHAARCGPHRGGCGVTACDDLRLCHGCQVLLVTEDPYI